MGPAGTTGSPAVGTPGSFQIMEASTEGSEYVELTVPTTIATARKWALPVDDPSSAAGQFLTTNASGQWSFSTVAVGGDDVQTVQTTNATTTTVATISITTGEQRVIRVRVRGFETTTGDMFWKEMTFGVKNIGGTVSIVGSIGSTFGYDAGASAWTVLANTSGSDALVEVTGEAAKTIDWTATIEES